MHSAGADHRVTVVSEPRFDPEMGRLRDVAAAARQWVPLVAGAGKAQSRALRSPHSPTDAAGRLPS